jgi:hypothetical protein
MKSPVAATVWRGGHWFVSQCLDTDLAGQGETHFEPLSQHTYEVIFIVRKYYRPIFILFSSGYQKPYTFLPGYLSISGQVETLFLLASKRCGPKAHISGYRRSKLHSRTVVSTEAFGW